MKKWFILLILFFITFDCSYAKKNAKRKFKRVPQKEIKHLPVSFAGEKIPTENPRINRKLKKNIRKYCFDKSRTYNLHQKAKSWFVVIEPILKAHNIPDDFKYIPLAESGMVHKGRSTKGALGFWQLMPKTAKAYGLVVTKKEDQRNNVVKSTKAVCKYLNHLHKKFGSWTLAAAAYNIGETKLSQHIRQQHTRNYYKLRLNLETSEYVYKIVSIKSIIERPEDFGYNNVDYILTDIPFLQLALE